MDREEWIRKIHSFYMRKREDLASRSSVAPHGRLEGQFGRLRSVKGYEHVIVYLQLNPRIDFEKVKHFLRFHLLEWVKNNKGFTESLDIFLFNNEEGKLLHNGKSWTRFGGPKVPLLKFIDNTVKKTKSDNIRTIRQLFPTTSLYTKYIDGQHPNSKDLLIFITDMEGCKVDDRLTEKLKRRLDRMIWIKLEKEKDVIIETRKIPILNGSLEKITNEMELEANINNISNHSSSKKYLDKSDFYLYYRTSDPWINQGMAKPIEITGNILAIADDLRMPFLRNMGETYLIPVDRVIELKNKLLRLNIFQIENDYPSRSMDGTYWQLSVSFDGKSVSSKGHNNSPARWNQIVDVIEECIKCKNKINMKGVQIMSNGKPKKLLKKVRLDTNLLHILTNNTPKWWENLKNDKEIVIEIRSNKRKSYIDCYYNGGCILHRLDSDKKGNLKGNIHYKYVPINFDTEGDYLDYDFRTTQINFKNIKPSIAYLYNFNIKTISFIKKQVENYYPNNSEKGYQYKFIQKDPYFIDSEFQYNELLGKNSRIDLVRLDHSVKKIVFVELKLFGNKELFNSKNGKNRNIEDQLNLYNKFIICFKDDLLKYYIDLIKLKKELGLLSNQVLKIVNSKELAKYSVADKPLLIIAGCTQKWIDNNAKDLNNRIKNSALGCLYFGQVNNNSDINKKGKNRYFFK